MHLVLITFFFQAHWSLVVVHVKERLIEHFDPLFQPSDCLTKIKDFLQEEAKGNKSCNFDLCLLPQMPHFVLTESFFS